MVSLSKECREGGPSVKGLNHDKQIKIFCIGAWEGEPHSFTGNMIKGIARQVVAYEDTLKDDNFKEKVGAVSSREISRIAKERRSGSMGYADTMVTLYNKRTSSNSQNYLHWDKLHLRRRNVAEHIQGNTID